MGFRLKSFVEIATSMLSHARAVQREVTDFNVGSVARTMHEASAIELDTLYQTMGQGLMDGIPTAIYKSFQFEQEPAVAAAGLVRFQLVSIEVAPVVIPAGTTVASRASGIQYQTAEQAIIPVGDLVVDVLVVATTPGTVGNAAPGAINVLVSHGIMAALTVRNIPAVANGRAMETEQERELRFIEYVRTLARGTVASVEYVCRQARLLNPGGDTIERVARVKIEETAGHVRAWIHNGAGATSAALMNKAQALVDGYREEGVPLPIPGYRPTGMRVDVVRMAEIPVPVEVEVQVPQGLRTDATRAAIVLAISTVIRSTASDSSLRPLDLLNAALTPPAVAGGDIVAPTMLVRCPIGAVLVPGTIEVRWA